MLLVRATLTAHFTEPLTYRKGDAPPPTYGKSLPNLFSTKLIRLFVAHFYLENRKPNKIQLNMGVTKTIKPIPKNYDPSFVSLESSLAKYGKFRSPGTSVTRFPFKEINGKYRTGLDVDAEYLQSWSEDEREMEIERIKKDKARLEEITGFDLGPRSQFYNYASKLPDEQKVTPVKLGTSTFLLNMSDPMQEITWNWIKVHPTIAPSLQAVQDKKVNIQVTQYYVADENAEDTITFKKKQALNKAIVQLDELNENPEKLRQIARLLGLPAAENVSQSTVYNMVDNLLKAGEFQTGEHKGTNPITVFTELLKLTEGVAHVRDLVNQAIKANIYRIRNNNKIYEGENEVATSRNDLVKYLMDDKNQADLFALEKKIKINKIADIHDQSGPTDTKKPAKAK